MGKLSRSELVRRLARKAFKQCDVDQTGSIDVKELHIALLLFYDLLNKKLPVYLKPPPHEEVQALLERYDQDASGHLDFEEFHDCVKAVLGMNEKAKFRDSVTFQIITRTALKMVLFPLAAFAIKKGLVAALGDEADKVPSAALVFALEGVYKVGSVQLQK